MKIGSEAVDATGMMSSGEKFTGPAELKQLLLARKDDFARNVTERMLAYALGRGVEFHDMPSLATITATLKNDGYRSSTLVTEIVKSYPFQFRRDSTPGLEKAQEKKP